MVRSALKRQKTSINFFEETGNEEVTVGDFNDDDLFLPESSTMALLRGPSGSSTSPVDGSSSGSSLPISPNVASSSSPVNISTESRQSDDQGDIHLSLPTPPSLVRSGAHFDLSLPFATSGEGDSFFDDDSSHHEVVVHDTHDEDLGFSIPLSAPASSTALPFAGTDHTGERQVAYTTEEVDVSVPHRSLSVATSSDNAAVPTLSRTMTYTVLVPVHNIDGTDDALEAEDTEEDFSDDAVVPSL